MYMDSSPPDGLSTLPSEILIIIFGTISRKNDLNSLCQVSKLFCELATPLLYESLVIECPEGFNPRYSILKRFSKTRPQVDFSSSIKYVRDLTLTTRFDHRTEHGARCWHHTFDPEEEMEREGPRLEGWGLAENCRYHTSILSLENDEGGLDEGDMEAECNCDNCRDEIGDDSDDSDSFEEFCETHFRDFCLALSENTLRSFRWELGSCVPLNILGQDGYLSRHQACLERLALITDGACSYAMDGESPYELTNFGNIREFSWIGAQIKEDFDAMRDCFVANASHLERLHLNLFDWSQAANFWYMDHTLFSSDPIPRENFFASDILGLSWDDNGGSHGLHFPALRHLFLGQLSFDFAKSTLVNAFSFDHLKELRLWNCPRTAPLLAHLTNSEQTLRLTCLELTCGWDDGDDKWEMECAVPPFLQKLSGLTELYLSLPVMGWTDITESFGKHLPTLETVVLHARGWNIDEESPYFESEEDLELDFCNGLHELFMTGHCEFLGIRNSPNFMRECLEPSPQLTSCRLLHLRASGDLLARKDCEWYVSRNEVDDFAEWAFSPNGLSQLLVLAFGDFAFRDKHEEDNVLYCRNNAGVGDARARNFKVLEPADGPLWEWVQDSMKALSACAYKPLFRV